MSMCLHEMQSSGSRHAEFQVLQDIQNSSACVAIKKGKKKKKQATDVYHCHHNNWIC